MADRKQAAENLCTGGQPRDDPEDSAMLPPAAMEPLHKVQSINPLVTRKAFSDRFCSNFQRFLKAAHLEFHFLNFLKI